MFSLAPAREEKMMVSQDKIPNLFFVALFIFSSEGDLVPSDGTLMGPLSVSLSLSLSQQVVAVCLWCSPIIMFASSAQPVTAS